ncbi:MAG: PhoU domain-containing protein [Planctomycetota bacterium]
MDPVREVRQAISESFSKVRQAFRTGDIELAKTVVATEAGTGAKCDAVIERLFQDKDIKTDRAVAYTLLARFLNRTGAHLANIATTVLRPAHLIDLPVSETECAEGAPADEPCETT